MTTDLAYLLNFLEDEFADEPRVRIRAFSPAGTRRSPDLPQDYDPDSNDLHSKSGVVVKVGTREYFFPVEWMVNRQFAEVRKLTEEIRERILGK